MSRQHLAHISPISRPYFAHISPISRPMYVVCHCHEKEYAGCHVVVICDVTVARHVPGSIDISEFTLAMSKLGMSATPRQLHCLFEQVTRLTPRLHLSCTSPAPCLYLAHVPPTSRPVSYPYPAPHLANMPPPSGSNLAHISLTSHPYLTHMSPTSRPYLTHISPISRPYLARVLPSST